MDQGNSYYNYMKQIPNWKQLLQLYETNSQLETATTIIWNKFPIGNSRPIERYFTSLIQRYSEPCQTSKLELFANIVNSFQPLTNFVKLSILGAWRGSEYASVFTSAEAQNAKFRSFCN